MRYIILLVAVCTLHLAVIAQPKTDPLLRNILAKSNSPVVKQMISNPDTFRLQIIYTKIDRDAKNVPSFKNYYFNFDNNLYFNPASTVKMPLAFLALEKFNTVGKKGIDKYTAMLFDSSFNGQVKMLHDSTSENYRPSIAHFIKKAFLVSDNDAYNRMYQFIGQGSINQWLTAKGYRNTRIIRQFMGFSDEQNRRTNQIRFIDKNNHRPTMRTSLISARPSRLELVISIVTTASSLRRSISHGQTSWDLKTSSVCSRQ
jgi:beta-lactamase class A